LISARAHQYSHGGTREHKRLSVSQSMTAATVAHGAEAIQERFQIGSAPRTWSRDPFLVRGQPRRPSPATQQGSGAWLQFLQVQLLRFAVLVVW
jgi:hypothetical protein